MGAKKKGSQPSPSGRGGTAKRWVRDGDYYLGFLNDYPEYQTQGMSKEELINNLKSLLADLESGEIPYIRKVEEMAAPKAH